jgi:hypothetical protein
LVRHPPCHPDPGQQPAPAQSPPRDCRPGESPPSGLPWGESGQVALRLLEVSVAPEADIGSRPDSGTYLVVRALGRA